MNDIIISADRAHKPLTVDASPTQLRLPKGSAILASRGDLWITQEGMRDDVILRPGDRFNVKGRGLILVSATRRGSAQFIVAPPARARLFDRAVHLAWQQLRRWVGASFGHHSRARFVHEAGH